MKRPELCVCGCFGGLTPLALTDLYIDNTHTKMAPDPPPHTHGWRCWYSLCWLRHFLHLLFIPRTSVCSRTRKPMIMGSWPCSNIYDNAKKRCGIWDSYSGYEATAPPDKPWRQAGRQFYPFKPDQEPQIPQRFRRQSISHNCTLSLRLISIHLHPKIPQFPSFLPV